MTDSPAIQQLLDRLPEFRPVLDRLIADEGPSVGSYLVVNEMWRWAYQGRDTALLRRVFTAVDEAYADASLADGRDLAIEFFESACAAGRDQFEQFIGPASREWFDQYGWRPVGSEEE